MSEGAFDIRPTFEKGKRGKKGEEKLKKRSNEEAAAPEQEMEDKKVLTIKKTLLKLIFPNSEAGLLVCLAKMSLFSRRMILRTMKKPGRNHRTEVSQKRTVI